MAEVLLFHHAQGQTEGLKAFADELRNAGHTVHTPDLFDGPLAVHARPGSAFPGGGSPYVWAGERLRGDSASHLRRAPGWRELPAGSIPAASMKFRLAGKSCRDGG